MAIFDKVANDYDPWYTSALGKFVDEVETQLAFSLFQPKPGMRILDVGCGTGNFSIKLAKMGCKVIGVDISEEMLAIARKKAADAKLDMEFHQMDVYHLDFEDNSFDGIFSMAAFEFIHDGKAAYQELFRVLNPGRKLLIGTIHRDSSWGRLYMSKEFQENSVFQHAKFLSLEELKSLDSSSLVDYGECLFLPPHIPEEEINKEIDQEYARTERGGFICAVWMKKE
ncbi:MAG: class I SAM-dependent methyltransferase [Bacillota bacterium]